MREKTDHIVSKLTLLGFVKSYLAGGTNTFVIGLTTMWSKVKLVNRAMDTS